MIVKNFIITIKSSFLSTNNKTKNVINPIKHITLKKIQWGSVVIMKIRGENWEEIDKVLKV